MIQAAIARVRHILQQDIAAEESLSVEEAEREYPPDYGGNQDDAYAAGEEDGKVRGRAALARVVLAILPPARELRSESQGDGDIEAEEDRLP